MKKYTFPLDERQAKQVFSPVRSKIQIIDLLMKTIKVMIINQSLDSNLQKGTIILIVSKMSRLFFFTENKYFSINFPFSVTGSHDNLRFYSTHIKNIDNKITSDVISLTLSNTALESDDIFDFVESIDEGLDLNPYFWSFIRELFLFETGYVRYDCDNEHENGLLHPLNHLDVFYSSNSTFKIGLNNQINYESLIDCLDIKSDCHFLDTE